MGHMKVFCHAQQMILDISPCKGGERPHVQDNVPGIPEFFSLRNRHLYVTFRKDLLCLRTDLLQPPGKQFPQLLIHYFLPCGSFRHFPAVFKRRCPICIVKHFRKRRCIGKAAVHRDLGDVPFRIGKLGHRMRQPYPVQKLRKIVSRLFLEKAGQRRRGSIHGSCQFTKTQRIPVMSIYIRKDPHQFFRIRDIPSAALRPAVSPF